MDISSPFELGGWRVEPAVRRACARDGTVVKIDPRNMRVLQVLAERQGEIVSAREIEQIAWEGVVVTPDSLYQCIRQLRQALGDTKTPAKYIETVPRRGYRLVAAVSCSTASPAARDAASEAQGAHQENDQPTAVPDRGPRWFRSSRFSIAGVLASVLLTIGIVSLRGPSSASEGPIFKTHDGSADVPATDAIWLTTQARATLREGRAHEAVRLFESALRAQMSSTGERSEVTLVVLSELATAHLWLDDSAAAYQAAAKAESMLEQFAEASKQERIRTLQVLCEVMTASGEYERAAAHVREAVALSQEFYGSDHIETSQVLSTHATTLHAAGRLSDADALARHVLQTSVRVRGAQHMQTAHARITLSLLLVDQERYAEAELEARIAAESLERVAGREHPYTASAMFVLAEVLLRQQKHAEAERLLRIARQMLVRNGASDWRVARASSALGEALLQGGRLSEAEQYLSQATAALTNVKGWPQEREARNHAARLELLAASKTSIRAAKL